MTETEEIVYGTRWRLVPFVLLPAVLLIAFIGQLFSSGALAAALVVQGGTTSISVNSLYGTNFAAAVVEQEAERADGTTFQAHVLRIGFAKGLVNGLCLSQEADIMGKKFALIIQLDDANASTWEITTGGVILDVKTVTGQLDMDGIVDLNRDGSDVHMTDLVNGNYSDVNPLDSPVNRFGIQGRYAKFDKLSGTVKDMRVLGSLKTTKINIRVAASGTTCPAPVNPVGVPPL
ncbi:hypothetical protein GCM10027589_33830 [Actinocorallia lasiicapitis]